MAARTTSTKRRKEQRTVDAPVLRQERRQHCFFAFKSLAAQVGRFVRSRTDDCSSFSSFHIGWASLSVARFFSLWGSIRHHRNSAKQRFATGGRKIRCHRTLLIHATQVYHQAIRRRRDSIHPRRANHHHSQAGKHHAALPLLFRGWLRSSSPRGRLLSGQGQP